MMKKLSAAVPLALAACAAAPSKPVSIRDAAGPAADCALKVDFGSYAMGIDGPAAQAIERSIAAEAGVSAVTRHRWGKEGEYSLCVQTGSADRAASLFERLQPLLPPAPRGPITLTLADGRTVMAPKR